MSIERIFIDMDGVLADFISSAMAVHGATYDAITYPRMEWSIAKVLGITEDEFWEKIDEMAPDFWPHIPPYEWMELLVDTAATIAPIALLSTPSLHPSCHYGKRQWVDKHLPGVELILCKSKFLLSKPGRVLIDDNDGNCAKWEAEGGTAMLFPQPWNGNHRFMDQQHEYAIERLAVFGGAT
jgi:5'(3')-deoxyribonucleotidase